MKDTAYGRSSSVYRVRPGIVVKEPHTVPPGSGFHTLIETSFHVEPLILERLQGHPNIVRYLGRDPDHRNGLLLGEASHGDLQTYLDNRGLDPADMTVADRQQAVRWCRQMAEALQYVHSRGVIHADLRAGNVLVHERTRPDQTNISPQLDLLLADFGGSVCTALDLDGRGLPSIPFCHPEFFSSSASASESLDLFGLGSLCYVILTGGHWPFRPQRPGRPAEREERQAYEERVEALFSREQYPVLAEDFPLGQVVLRCWKREYASAAEVVRDMDAWQEEHL